MPRTIECPSCGAAVQGARLSCPSCGAILAAVRGAPREASGARRGPVGEVERHEAEQAAVAPPVELAAEGAPAVGPADVPAETGVGASWQPEPTPPSPETPTRGVPIGPPPILREWGGPELSAAPAPVASPGSRGTASAAERPPIDRPIPGAYLPPSAVFSPPGAAPPTAASPGAPGPSAPSPAANSVPGLAPPSALALRALGHSAVSWLLVSGSIVAVVAFLLPWSPNGVIGSPGDPGYLGRWGLANGAYLLVMAASFACLAAQVLETRLPPLVRDGVLPLVLGGFLLGFGWTYVAGPFGADLGVQAILLGGLLLVAGGVLGLRAIASRAGGPPAS